MPRPLNKTQLLTVSQKEYSSLEVLLKLLSLDKLEYTSVPDAWSVKDVLAHLYEWQQMLFTWYETGLRGDTPELPAPGYKWNQIPQLNHYIYKKYCDMPPEKVLLLFRESHQKSLRLIESLSDADLTTPGFYKWMNQNTLLSYLTSTTASHYIWALKEIKKSMNK